jgi:hypothetical protein
VKASPCSYLELKPATVNWELSCLSHVFNLAKREKQFFCENPASISKLLPENNQVERILISFEKAFFRVKIKIGR